jgi:hypothetical protein
MGNDEKPPLPLDDLASRHPGLTLAIAESYLEAASVCFHRHHESPVDVSVEHDPMAVVCVAKWNGPTERTQNAWANEIDTTEGGAYGVSLAAVELLHGMVAVKRAQTLSGADYYIGPAGEPVEDLESCLRLEVSGTDRGDRSDIRGRLVEKKNQLRKGQSNLPALAAVVGFRELVVALASVEGQ